MSRGNSGGYGHHVHKLDDGYSYEVSWKYDNTYGRVRFPRVMRRLTDRKGAERFAKKWKTKLP